MMTALLVTLVVVPVAADAPLEFGFEAGDTANWAVTTGEMSIAADVVRDGNGALQCAYTAQPGAPLAVTLTNLEVAGAQSLLMSVRTSSQTPIVLRLSEADGSPYHTFLTTIGGEWTDVRLPLADFQLQDGSTDENEGLDADQIVSLAIEELSNMAGEMGNIFGQKQGAQTMHIDVVRFGTEAVASRGQTAKGKVVVDDFSGDALHFLAVGQSRIERVADQAGQAGGAVGLGFTFAAEGALAWPGIVVPLGHVELTAPVALRIRGQAAGPLGLHVLLEEWDGSRYESTARIEAGGEWVVRDLKIADFTLDPARSDENNELDPEQLRVVVVVVDVFNALLDDRAAASCTLDEIVFLTE